MNLVYAAMIVLYITSVQGHFGDQWTQVFGKMESVVANINYLVGRNPSNRLYVCTRPCNGDWVHTRNDIVNFAVDDDYIWANDNGRKDALYRRKFNGNWESIGVFNSPKDIALGGHGYNWGINTNNLINICKKPCDGAWGSFGDEKLSQIDSGIEYVYGINTTTHTVSYHRIDGRGEWRNIPGEMKYVTAGLNDIFGIGNNQDLYRCEIPCTGSWERVGFPWPGLNKIDATIDGLFAVTTGGDIYRHEIPF